MAEVEAEVVGAAGVEVLATADGDGSAVRNRLDFSFSCWTAAFRPLRVKGRFAIPTSWECWEISLEWEIKPVFLSKGRDGSQQARTSSVS